MFEFLSTNAETKNSGMKNCARNCAGNCTGNCAGNCAGNYAGNYTGKCAGKCEGNIEYEFEWEDISLPSISEDDLTTFTKSFASSPPSSPSATMSYASEHFLARAESFERKRMKYSKSPSSSSSAPYNKSGKGKKKYNNN
eukprot:Pgem_evm1s12323